MIASPRSRALVALALGYAVGVLGTLWDWYEHLIGPGTQPPHLVIDLAGLIVLGVLAFSGRRIDLRSRTFAALYVLLILVAIVAFGPFVMMVTARHSTAMTIFVGSIMTPWALLAYSPLVLLALWAAWWWTRSEPFAVWRVGAAGGIVIVAAASVWDLYWHQTHAMEMRASMASLPPHQAIL